MTIENGGAASVFVYQSLRRYAHLSCVLHSLIDCYADAVRFINICADALLYSFRLKKIEEAADIYYPRKCNLRGGDFGIINVYL